MKKHEFKFHEHKFIHASGWLYCPSCGLTKHNPYVGPPMGRINAAATLYLADETAAQSITLDTEGRSTLEVFALADVETNFRLDVSVDNSIWITNFETWPSVMIVKEGYLCAYRFIRLRSDAVPGAVEKKVSLVLSAGG